MLVLLSLALLGANAKIIQAGPKNRTESAQTYWKMWQEFKRVENKTYLTSTHHNERFEIFKDNVDTINRHNSEGHTWRMGVTPFADLTVEEFAERIVGRNSWVPRTSTEREVWKDTSNVPDSIDWVAQNKVTAVKNQGQCGSCWAFSTTGSVESRYAIAKGQLNELSEQELVDCSKSDGNNGCNGGLMDYGFKYVQESGGLCSESGFPYDAKTETTKCAAGKRACGQRLDPITGYHDVTPNSMEQLQAAVAEGPVSVAIQANQQAFQLYKEGVMDGRCGSRLDHGVLAVGYGTDATDGKFWKVKNSWGARWGENGYIRMCRDCDKNRGAGQCGILGQPSYPQI